MSRRDLVHVKTHPLAGDVIELREKHFVGSTDEYDCETMLRVIAVAEELVWFKEYGKGRKNIVSVKEWKERIDAAQSGTLIRGADHDAPF